MKRFLCAIDTVSDWSGRIFSLIVVIIMIIIGYEVVARYVFNAPTIWATETTTLLCGIYSVIGGLYTLYVGGHVNVDALYSLFSPRGRAFIDLLTFPIIFFFFCVLIWTSSIYGWESLNVNETTGSVANLPIYPAKMTLAIASFFMLLQGLAKFIRDLQIVITGNGAR